MSKVTGFRPGSKSWKKFMAKLYGFGAAIVIIGAMFKIQHWPGAGPMLVVGLSTEAVIFFFSAFEPIHEDPDWTLVYPELAGFEEEAHGGEHLPEKVEEKGSIIEQLDNMLEEAKIGPELIESLGEGFRGLSDQVGKLGGIADASVASDEFATSIRGASQSASQLSEAYVKTAESLSSSTSELSQTLSSSASRLSESYVKTAEQLSEQFAFTNGESGSYKEQVQKLTQNLSALNSVYELQLKGSDQQSQATTQFYEKVTEMLQNLSDSVEDTKKYKDGIAELSRNLQALNTVYGNMLSAMGSGARG